MPHVRLSDQNAVLKRVAYPVLAQRTESSRTAEQFNFHRDIDFEYRSHRLFPSTG